MFPREHPKNLVLTNEIYVGEVVIPWHLITVLNFPNIKGF